MLRDHVSRHSEPDSSDVERGGLTRSQKWRSYLVLEPKTTWKYRTYG